MPARTRIPLPPRYRDPHLLAYGGMGEIYRATDEELGREVAVKVLSARYAQDDELRRRFRREALAAARVSANPNIVTVFDVAEHEGRPMIVMELLKGGSLEQRLSGRAPYPPQQALAWLEQAAAALDAAHAAGVVHRDVKPGNLLLDDAGRVRVADFGIASAAGLDSFTKTGTILGTAGYLSPEQAAGERAGAASDLYALAVVAWELLAGRRPFASDSPTAEATAHLRAPVPSIHDANPSLPRSLDAVFRRALAKDPRGRYPTAAALAAALREALEGGAADTWVIPPAPPPAVERTPRRLLPALVLALLLGAGIAVAILLSERGGSPSVRTVTRSGTTVHETVTTSQATTAAPPSSAGSGSALNDEGFAKMRAGDYRGALPLLEQAVAKLNGTGETVEAYADYNLAYTRFALGDCTDVLALLDRSEQVQGHRSEITRLRHDARKTCR